MIDLFIESCCLVGETSTVWAKVNEHSACCGSEIVHDFFTPVVCVAFAIEPSSASTFLLGLHVF